MQPLITIFTPTYNRAHLLPRLFSSLKNLENKNFEWLIIDDGSNDDSKKLINNFINEDTNFNISYYYQKNQGKHIAINNGVEKAKGKLFFIVDSDDYLPFNSVTIIQKYYSLIKDKKDIISLAGRIFFKNSPNKNFPFQELTASSFYVNQKYSLGDVAEVYKTNILKKYKFPNFEKENFCTEALVWNRISKKYKQLYFNEVIYYTEYQDGGLTSNYWKLLLKNPKGAMLYYKELLEFPLEKKQRKDIVKIYNNIAKANHYSKFRIIQEIGLANFIKIYL